MAAAGEPMKAKLIDAPFSDPGWVFERKLDGIRALVRWRGCFGQPGEVPCFR